MKQQSGIYCITINSKQYIGSSINIKKRLIQHKSDLKNNKHCNPYLQNAFNKYNEFIVEYLELLDSVSIEKLVEREKYWIVKNKAIYNIQDPVTNFCIKEVYQFDGCGVLVRKYNNVYIAAAINNISFSSIQHAAQKNEINTKTAAGFYWSYTKIPLIIKDLRLTNIYLYNIKGEYIDQYPTLKEVISTLFSKRSYSSIASVINRITKYKTASLEGYRFSYIKVNQLDNTKLLTINKNYPIVQMSYDNKVEIKVWENIKSAAKNLNCTRNIITDAIIKNHRCQGYYWKRLGI